MPKRFFSLCLLSHILLTLSSPKALAQDQKEMQELYAELDSLFSDETIPGNLFELADSLLALEKAKTSAFNLRFGYVSEVVSAGRAFGFDQYGFISGISYFHHSGFFGSATGYWSNEYSPNYYLTNASVGYSYWHKQKLTLQANHDFYFYNDTLEYHSFNKSAQVAVSYQLKYADAGIDYAYLYGNDAGHRVTARANARYKVKLTGFLDAITFMPGASFQWGNADVLYWRQPRTAVVDLYRIIKANDYPLLGRREYLKLTYLLEQERELAAAFFLRQRGYSGEQILNLLDLYYEGSVSSENTFGFLNYSFSFPVIVRAGRVSLLMNYTYNIPQALPGESYEYESNSFFSTSLSYLLHWNKR